LRLRWQWAERLARPLPPLLIGALGLAAAMGIGRFAFTPLLPLMQDRHALTLAQAGALASANYLGYLLGALACVAFDPAPRNAARHGLVAVALTTIAMGLAGGFAAWLALRLAAGVASAFVLVGVSGWTLAALAREQRSAEAGWMFCGIGAGIGLAGVIGLVVGATRGDPAWGWIGLGGVAALVAALAWHPLSRPEAPIAAAPSAATVLPRFEVARMVACYGVFGFGYIIPATFLPALARDLVGDPRVYGWTWPIFGLAAALSTAVAATVLRRVAPRRLWAGCLVVMAVGVAAGVLDSSLAGLVVAAVCVGSTFVVATLAGLQEARRVAGRAAPRLIAAMTAAFALGQLIGPLTLRSTGSIADAAFGPSVAAAALLLASAALLVVRPAAPG
jgi:predicted MFS family arabinose efflux permease